MRKKEMTKQQLADRQKLIDVLGKAGWEGTAFNGLFEKGRSLEDEASMEYSGKMDLTANYTGSTNSLNLHLTDPGTGKEVGIRVDFGDRLDNILKTIVGFQDKISASNFRDRLSEIVRIVPETYADRGDQGWQKLVDEPEAKKPKTK